MKKIASNKQTKKKYSKFGEKRTEKTVLGYLHGTDNSLHSYDTDYMCYSLQSVTF